MSFLLRSASRSAGLKKIGAFGLRGFKEGKDKGKDGDKGKRPGQRKKDVIRDLFEETTPFWEQKPEKPHDALREKYAKSDKRQKANNLESLSSAEKNSDNSEKNSDNSRKGFFSRKRLLNLLYAPTSAKEFAMYEAYNNGQENVANIGDRISGGVEKVLSQGGGDTGRVLGAASDNSADNNSTMPFIGWGGKKRGEVPTKIKGAGDRILGQGRGREIRKPESGSSGKGEFRKAINSGSLETFRKSGDSNRRIWPTESELVGSGSGDFRDY